MVPTLIASFANYTVAVAADPGASWPRYFTIHFFYWLAWGLIGETAYRVSPDRLRLRGVEVPSFVARHTIVLIGALTYFSFYFILINPTQFSGLQSAGDYLAALYTRSGSVLFHVMNAVTYLFVLGAALLLRQSRYARAQELERLSVESKARQLEASLAEAKLSVLNSQIHPHFLFNSLNNIASLIAARDNDHAYEAVALLGRLLRKTLQYVGRPSIALQAELDLIGAMMRIGKIRFGDRLTWECRSDTSLHDEPVPPFIVQPLVENALRHAVEATMDPVHIRVEVREENGELCFSVVDNGPGPASETIPATGVGLTNLRERLSLMGGSDLEITSPGGEQPGFAVSFRLPLGALS